MRGAFVVQLGPETDPVQRLLEGWVEEVDSCIGMRFRSTEELVRFMSRRLELVKGLVAKPPPMEAPDPLAVPTPPEVRKRK